MTVDVGVGVGVDMTLALTLTFCMLRIIEGVSGEGRVDMDGFGGGDDWSSSARGGGIDWCVRLLSCVCVGWGGGQIGYGCVRKVYPG